MIYGLIIYLLYMTLNAFLLKSAISLGFDHNIGWGSAILFSLVSSMFVVVHRYRKTDVQD
jgi:hypothetical protein